MTHQKNINAINITEQRAIKTWYTYTIVIFVCTCLILTSITIVQLYQAMTLPKICKPSLGTINTPAIKKKYDHLAAELKKTEQHTALQEKGWQSLTHYQKIITLHAENTLLSPVINLYLKPTSITAEYAIQSPQIITKYMDTLKNSLLFKELFFSSFSKQQSATPNICIIQAEWV